MGIITFMQYQCSKPHSPFISKSPLCIILIFLSACSVSQKTPTPTITSTLPIIFSTATLIPTITPRISPSKVIPTAGPTVPPVTAITSAQVNVREFPDTNSKSLGYVNAGITLLVLGKNDDSKWVRVNYPNDSKTMGWVKTNYIQISISDLDNLNIVDSNLAGNVDNGMDGTITPVAADLLTTPVPRVGRVKAQIFVRTGPGQIFESLGQLQSGTSVTVIGRNINNLWVKIIFEDGSKGDAWIASAYIDGVDYLDLPFFDNQGVLLSAVNENQLILTLSPTVLPPSVEDGDSEKEPSSRIEFSPTGTREFSFSGDLSSPIGDKKDWIIFIPYEPTNQSTYLYFNLECTGNGGISTILKMDGIPVDDWKPLTCGNYDFAEKLLGGKEYTLLLTADGSFGPVRYVKYTLSIRVK